MRLSLWKTAKYLIMLLDHLFKPLEPVQIVIIRKNGKIKYETRPVVLPEKSSDVGKPLFPISKDRK